MNPGEFRNFLIERFGMVIPKGIQISRDSGSAVRVYSSSLDGLDIYGSKGFVAYSKKTGLSSDFIQIFGIFSNKNYIELEEKEALLFVNNEKIKKRVKLSRGYIILKYKKYVIGTGMYDGFFIHPNIREKRNRKIENDLKK